MATLTYLDTHVVAWLYAGEVDRLSPPARTAVEVGELTISPMAALELQYLYEIRRIAVPSRVILDTLRTEVGLRICDAPWPRVLDIAIGQGWTRDPFDRLIVSHAALREAPLVTKDETIRRHYPRAVWEMPTTAADVPTRRRPSARRRPRPAAPR